VDRRINNLPPSSIESLELTIPSIDEQNAITAILSDMDAEIAALEAHRDKARSLVKQGMMQQLLTGNIRLV
jgi:type I restriction enzyme S subunit